jgi:ParB family chromosome partitioning protein
MTTATKTKWRKTGFSDKTQDPRPKAQNGNGASRQGAKAPRKNGKEDLHAMALERDVEEVRSRLTSLRGSTDVWLPDSAKEFVAGVLDGKVRLVPGTPTFHKAEGLIEAYWRVKGKNGKARPAMKEEFDPQPFVQAIDREQFDAAHSARMAELEILNGPSRKGAKAQRSTAKAHGKNGKARPIVGEPAGIDSPRRAVDPRTERIATACIDRCAWQPRRDFPAEEIAVLAQSIRENGQKVPIRVRTRPKGRYELIAGERRLRAVVAGGATTIRAEIIEATDAEVRREIFVEGLQRKDWNAIEEAAAFRAAIDAGDAAGPTELAGQLGLSQGHISNRLRLLELPEAWRKRVISGEMPAAHALSVCRYRKSPVILAAIEKRMKEEVKYSGSLGTADDFDDIVDSAASAATASMATAGWDNRLGKRPPVFTPTDQERGQLGLIEVPIAKGKTESRATNVKLWKKLQAEHEARLAKSADAKTQDPKPKAGNKGNRPPTAAEQKRIEAADRQRDKDRAQKLEKGLWRLAIDWRRWLLAKACRERQVSLEDALRFLLYFVASNDWHHSDLCGWTTALERMKTRELILWNGLSDGGSRVPCKHGHPDLVPALRAIADDAMIDRAADFLGQLFWDGENGPDQIIPDEVVLAATEQLAIDLAAAWKKEAAGELTERWLNLRGQDALLKMAIAGGLVQVSGPTKAKVVAAFMPHAKKLKPPAELLKPKKPK